MADTDDFSDLITTTPPATAGGSGAPDFSDLTTTTPPPGTQPEQKIVAHPEDLSGQPDPFGTMKNLTYEAAKGASFGLSPLVATPEQKESANRFEEQHPYASAGAELAGGLAPGYLIPGAAEATGVRAFGETAPWFSRVLGNAGFGAGAGAISGAANAPPGQALSNAGYGAITGGALGGVLGGLSGEVFPIVRKIVSGGSGDYVGEKATNLIAQTIGQDAEHGSPGALAIADALDRANNAGVPFGIGDVGGENTRALMGNLYRVPGEPRAAISNFFNARDEGATSRLLDAIDGSVNTGSKTADEAVQEQLVARSQAARPLYEALYNRYPVVSSDRLNQFIGDPVMQQGLSEGIKLQRLEALRDGVPFDPQGYTLAFNAAGDPVWQGTPNLRTLDAAKRGLDALLSGDQYRNQFGQLTQMGRAVDGVRRSFVNELDSLTGGQDGAYAQARAAWAGPSRAMEMIKEGGQWMQKDPGQLSREVGTLAPGDRDFYLLGVANQMRQSVLAHADTGDESKRVLNSPLARQRAQAIFSPDTYQALEQRVLGERQAFQTYSNVAKGSPTAGRFAEDKARTPDHGSLGGLSVPLLAEVATHNPYIAGTYAGYKGVQGLRRWGNTPSPAVQAEAARLLSGSTPEQANLARGIANAGQSVPRFTRALIPGVSGIAGRIPGEFMRGPLPQQAEGGGIAPSVGVWP